MVITKVITQINQNLVFFTFKVEKLLTFERKYIMRIKKGTVLSF